MRVAREPGEQGSSGPPAHLRADRAYSYGIEPAREVRRPAPRRFDSAVLSAPRPQLIACISKYTNAHAIRNLRGLCTRFLGRTPANGPQRSRMRGPSNGKTKLKLRRNPATVRTRTPDSTRFRSPPPRACRCRAPGWRNVEKASGHDLRRRNGHAAVVVRAGILHVPIDQVCEAHQGVIGRALDVISVSRALRYSRRVPMPKA